MKKKVNITICGDICPTNDTEFFFQNGKTDSLLGEVKQILTNTDLLIGNLEFPLVDECQKVVKTGPILCGKTEYINFFKDLNFTALGLGNNHIKDCGEDGVISSLYICKKNGIKTVGAGNCKLTAKKPLVIEENGFKIAFLAFCEHEFNVAYENEAGANLFDIFHDYEQIESLKKEVDYLIIMYHGGIEHYIYPSPLLQKRCQKMINKGADYVVCQHSHIIGTKQKYKNGTILYGQGNTIYGHRKNDSSWNEGLIIKISLTFIDGNLKSNIGYIPIEATYSGVKLMCGEKRSKLIEKMKTREKEITQKDFILNSWKKFCKSKESLYLPQLYGKGRIFNKLNRLLNNRLMKLFFSKKRFLITNNLIRCEAHNEVVQTILKGEES